MFLSRKLCLRVVKTAYYITVCNFVTTASADRLIDQLCIAGMEKIYKNNLDSAPINEYVVFKVGTLMTDEPPWFIKCQLSGYSTN